MAPAADRRFVELSAVTAGVRDVRAVMEGAVRERDLYDRQTVLRQEVETLGFLVSRHPLALYKSQWQRHRPIKASELIRHSGKWVTMVGWWITTKAVEDKHGRPMEFVSFEDVTAIFDATFFPDVYARFCRKLSQRRPYLLKGVVEEEFGVATLRVKWVGFLDG